MIGRKRETLKMSRIAIMGILGSIAVSALVALAVSADTVQKAGLPAIVWCVIGAFVIQWIVFVHSWITRSEKFFDLTGSATYILMTVLALLLADDIEPRDVLIAALVWIWAARLGTYLFRRISADGHDGRFDKIKTNFGQLLMTWTIQGMWVSLTAIAAWTAITTETTADFGVVGIVGVVVWVIGFAIEVRADTEKSAFKADPANEGRFISSGIWAWSRHPNYFGEITLWTGMALLALAAFDGWEHVALISPVFVTLLLTRISGIPMLERRGLKRWGSDPDYQEYLAETPVLILRPPRR